MEVEEVRWSEEKIIDLIQKLRNDLIEDFLDEHYLRQYILSRYNRKELSSIKIELLKQELKQLALTPINVGHYRGLIKLITETDTASLSKGNEQLFYSEIEKVMQDYVS